MSSPYQGLQDLVAQLPEFVQPLVIAGLGMIPYVEGEGSAALGIIVGIHPIVAAVAGASGNILSVVAVVTLSARIRAARAARRARRAAALPLKESVEESVKEPVKEPALVAAREGSATRSSPDADAPAGSDDSGARPTRGEKGRRRLRGWLVRFGVPGASLLAPLALPTQLTAAFLVASGVKKSWVILWQVIAIVLWTGLVAAVALGLVTALGW